MGSLDIKYNELNHHAGHELECWVDQPGVPCIRCVDCDKLLVGYDEGIIETKRPLLINEAPGKDESFENYSIRMCNTYGIPVHRTKEGYLEYTLVMPGQYWHVAYNGGLYRMHKDTGGHGFYKLVIGPDGANLPSIMCRCGNTRLNIYLGKYGIRGECTDCNFTASILEYTERVIVIRE